MTKKKRSPPPAPKPAKEKPFFRPFAGAVKLPPKPEGKAAPSVAPRPAPKVETPAGDDVSFGDLLYGVTPIDRGPRAEPQRVALPERPRVGPDPDDAARAYLRELVEGGESRFETIDDGTRLEGRRIDVDPRALRRLRRGELPIDARCDLHGLAAGEARTRVEGFVTQSRARGERVLLVIHGRGTHSPGPPVLRGEIASWLSQGAASSHVAAFATAIPDDGGDGALYVLLR